MAANDLDTLLTPPAQAQLTQRLVAALATAGLPANVEIVVEQPLQLQSTDWYRVLGSRGGAHGPALGVVLCPKSKRANTAATWLRKAAGEGLVRRIVAERLPAHIAVRVLYRVRDRAGVWQVVDPPRLGQARLGRIVTKETIRMAKHALSTDARLTELFADLRELYGIDPAADPAAWDELTRRERRRQQPRHGDGDWFDADLVNNLENRLAALERLVAVLAGNARPERRKHQRQPGDIPLNR
jgi:hypothetical protein